MSDIGSNVAAMSQQPNPTTTTVTEEIAALMGRRGRLSAVKLAKDLGWSYSYLSRRLNGANDWTIGDLDQIADYFDVPITDLFGRSQGVNSGWIYTRPEDREPELVSATS